MRRIGLFLGVTPESGGAFQYTESMLAALCDLDRRTLTLVLAVAHPAWTHVAEAASPSGGVTQLSESVSDRVSRLAIRAGLPSGVFRSLSQFLPGIARDLRAEACDLWIFPSQEHYAYSSKINSIGTIHDLMHRFERRFPEVSARGLYWRRENHYSAMCKHSTAILTDSRIGKEHVVEAYAAKEDQVYPLPYCPPPRKPMALENEQSLLARLGLEGKAFFFYPAQFWEHKNHLRLIDAYSHVKKFHPDVCLLLTGSRKNGSEAVARKIAALGLDQSVITPGYIDEAHVQALYKYATALVMPTFFGPTNIPPLDAMRAGCPMALSDIYGMREQSGDAAIYFDPEVTQTIAQAMLRILTDPDLRERMRRNGLARSLELDFTAFVRRLNAILSSVSTS